MQRASFSFLLDGRVALSSVEFRVCYNNFRESRTLCISRFTTFCPTIRLSSEKSVGPRNRNAPASAILRNPPKIHDSVDTVAISQNGLVVSRGSSTARPRTIELVLVPKSSIPDMFA